MIVDPDVSEDVWSILTTLGIVLFSWTVLKVVCYIQTYYDSGKPGDYDE